MNLAKMKWGDSKTIKFIRLYERQPCLWDPAAREYSARPRRLAALDDIVARMNLPNFTADACKAKIKNIRSQYCHELKRIKKSLRLGGRVYKPTLAWFDAVDRFLRPIVVQRSLELSENQEQGPAQATDVEFVDYSKKSFKENDSDEETPLKTQEEPSNLESDTDYEEEPLADVSRALPESASSSRAHLDRHPDRKHDHSLKQLNSAIKKLEDSLAKRPAAPGADEFHVFGQSVAAQLTNMPLEDAIQLQMEIQQLITAKRLNRLSNT